MGEKLTDAYSSETSRLTSRYRAYNCCRRWCLNFLT